MATVSVGGQLNLTASLIDTIGLAPSNSTAQLRVTPNLSSGTTGAEVTLLYSAVCTMTDATYDLDITGGIEDAHGNTLTFDKIYAMGIENNSSTNDMTLTWRVNAATDSISVLKPGGSMFWYAPAGSASTVSDLQIVGTTTDTFDIMIAGEA